MINLNKPEVVWRKPFGYLPGENETWGSSFHKGGILLTQSGLIFAPGTVDSNLWVFNSANGDTLFKYPLPIFHQSTGPIIYRLANKPYVVMNILTGDKINGTLYGFSIPVSTQQDSLWWIGIIVAAGLILVSIFVGIRVCKRSQYSTIEK